MPEITDMTLEEAMDLGKWRPGVHYVSQAGARMRVMKAEIERLRPAADKSMELAVQEIIRRWLPGQSYGYNEAVAEIMDVVASSLKGQAVDNTRQGVRP